MIAKGRPRLAKGNNLERAYSLVLSAQQHRSEISWWRYEGITLKLADDTRYTPDFAIMLANGEMEMHETKGFMRDDAWVKLKVAAQQFPFRFVLVKKVKGGNWDFKEV